MTIDEIKEIFDIKYALGAITKWAAKRGSREEFSELQRNRKNL